MMIKKASTFLQPTSTGSKLVVFKDGIPHHIHSPVAITFYERKGKNYAYCYGCDGNELEYTLEDIEE